MQPCHGDRVYAIDGNLSDFEESVCSASVSCFLKNCGYLANGTILEPRKAPKNSS